MLHKLNKSPDRYNVMRACDAFFLKARFIRLPGCKEYCVRVGRPGGVFFTKMEGTLFQFLNRIIDAYAGALCDCEV